MAGSRPILCFNTSQCGQSCLVNTLLSYLSILFYEKNINVVFTLVQERFEVIYIMLKYLPSFPTDGMPFYNFCCHLHVTKL